MRIERFGLKWTRIGLLGAVALLAVGCIPETEGRLDLRIGDKCTSPEQCGAIDALCEPRTDGIKRCWAEDCDGDTECGPGGACVFVRDTGDGTPSGPLEGLCRLKCEVAADCPRGTSNSTWYCETMENVQGEHAEQKFCLLEPKPFCGNGVRERGEECDDGNYLDGDGCTSECLTEIGCGNGRLDVNEDEQGLLWKEECDDDNTVDGDGCSADCRIEGDGPECGNGILEVGEGCDPEMEPWRSGGGCTAACQRDSGCGDGEVSGEEQCDDGNVYNHDGCNDQCMYEYHCGNEVCEEGNFENCERCPEDCCPDCGDGELDEGEECDDGGNENGDGCSKGCHDEDGVATCGNGIWEVGEECEDGNTDPADGCAPDCTREFVCGDQICDHENHETCRLCPEDCCPRCGNGVWEIQYGESCDASELQGLTCQDFCYDGGTLGCTEWCDFDTSGCTGTGPICGDGVAECSEPCDSDDLRGNTCLTLGYDTGTLSCDGNCEFDVSGCGPLVWYLFEDFESTTAGDWTYNGDWSVGVPTDQSIEPNAYSGAFCAGTAIGGEYSDDNAIDQVTLVSPEVNLAAADAPVLTFYQWMFADDPDDGGTVWISDDGGVNWVYLDNARVEPDYNADDIDGMYGYSGDKSGLGWHRVVVDIADYAGAEVRVRFSFYTDSYSYNDGGGWYIDDVLFTEWELIPVKIKTSTDLGVALSGELYERELQAWGGSGDMTWSIEGGTNHSWLSIDASTGVLSGTPSAGDLGTVSVTIRAADQNNSANLEEKTFELDVVEGIYLENFDGTQPSDWTFNGDWEWGSASGGPSGCSGGSSHCMGTNIDGNYSNGNSWTGCVLDSPDIDLSSATSPQLIFYQYVDTETSWDGGNVRVSDDGGSSWTILTNAAVEPDYYDDSVGSEWAYSGHYDDLGWHEVVVDLSAYAGQTINIRFAYYSDGSINSYPGWFIDEVLIVD